MTDVQNTFFLYMRAAENLADVSSSRKLDAAKLTAAQTALSAAQKAYWKAVDDAG